jgi:hypothetical protein
MTREELEHIIRASGDITDPYEFVIVGSQAILGSVPNPEAIFTVSMEADIYPKDAPELAEKIDGAIGEGSQFHDTYGYYAHGVGSETATLPKDWQSRVHKVRAQHQSAHRLLPRRDRSFPVKGRSEPREKTARFALRRSSIATSRWHEPWSWRLRCRSKEWSKGRCEPGSAARPRHYEMPATTSRMSDRGHCSVVKESDPRKGAAYRREERHEHQHRSH